MGDDAVGIRVAEELSTKLMNQDTELIFGETDNEYALSRIDDGDLLFIIDSTYFDSAPGTVTFTSINELPFVNNLTSQHQPSLIHLIKLYGKNVSGFIIGIEAEKIEFSTELSESLKIKLYLICQEVYEFITSKTDGHLLKE